VVAAEAAAVTSREPIDAELITARIVETLRATGGHVSGPVLGKYVNTAFPNVNMRNTFGGLRKFIETHCSGKVTRVSAVGNPDFYALADASDSTALPDAWQAFVNPRAEAAVAVDCTGQCAVFRPTGTAPEGFTPIPSLSASDYRRVAQDFIALCEPQAGSALTATLTAEPFWPAWSAGIAALGHDLARRWSGFRRDFILRQWSERGLAAGVPLEAIRVSTLHLQTTARVAVPRRHQEARGEHPQSLRTVVHLTIDALSDGELRNLWLPLGRVLDALQR
jgi:hypothetical protein